MYDYLIVGAGLSGAIFAHEATKHGKKICNRLKVPVVHAKSEKILKIKFVNFLSKVIRTSITKIVKNLIIKKYIKNNTNINFTKPNIEKELIGSSIEETFRKVICTM